MKTTPLLLLLLSGLAFAQFPSQLKNVVVIVQENRTPDNLFHFLTPACPIPAGASGYQACIPTPVTNSCYDVSPCGLSNQSGTVVPITLTAAPMVGLTDPFHNHTAFVNQCDPDSTFKCRNDGAWQTAPNNIAYTYVSDPPVTNYDGSSGFLLDPYLTFAKQYGWANFMYQTNQGPSYPAHQFLFSGTSARTNAEDAASIFVSENFGNALNSGCIARNLSATTHSWNRMIQPTNPLVSGCFLFDGGSVQECQLFSGGAEFCQTTNNLPQTALEPHGISWKYYAGSAGSLWTAPDSIQSICNPQPDAAGNPQCTGTEWSMHVDIKNHGTDILRDISQCQLAQVSWVTPTGGWADHMGPSPPNFPYGPSWVAAVINAIGNNPTCPAGTPDAGQNYWDNTVIVVTWDDWGGFSDNQPAKILGKLPCVDTTPATPCPGDYQFGFRVPLLVVSAYTPAGFIHNTPHDFGSILRMIEGINHLPEGLMGNADARSTTDLGAFFNVKMPARPYKTVPAVVDANFFLTNTLPPAAPDVD